MRNRKKYTEVFIIGMIIALLVGTVSAQDVIGDDSKYNFFTDLIYQLKEVGLFTAAGQARLCSVDADYTIGPVSSSTYVSTSTLLNSAGCDVALFDLFDRDWHFKGEYRSEDVGGFQLSSITSTYSAIVEVYCCPYEACNSNADCIAMEEGTNCNIAYGSCYGDIPSHSTKIYKCINEKWIDQGIAVYGEDNFCMDITDNNYIDRSGGEHCRLSTYSSVNDGTWCGISEVDCSIYETRNQCNDDLNCEWEEGTWLVHGKCVEKVINGNGVRGNQKGINKTDIVKLTYSNLKDSLCVETEDCKKGVCLPQDYLINKGYLFESKAKSTLSNYCDEGDIRTLLEILGGYVGLTEGVCGWIVDDYDQWVTSYGYCIIDYEDEEVGITQFLRSIGRAIPITGDPLTDGIIVLGGGILLLVLIMSRLYYGEIKYETKQFYR